MRQSLTEIYEARVAAGSFPSMNAMLLAQLWPQVVTETDAQALGRYRAQLADEGLAQAHTAIDEM